MSDVMRVESADVTSNAAEAVWSPQEIQEWLEQMPAWMEMLRSGNPRQQLDAAGEFRQLLSISSPPYDEVIAVGAVPELAKLLEVDDTSLQFEAAWALTNVATSTSERTRTVVDAGAVPSLVRLLSSPDADVREQAAWALGNIAVDNPAFGDLVRQLSAAYSASSHLAGDTANPAMRNNAVRMLRALCGDESPL